MEVVHVNSDSLQSWSSNWNVIWYNMCEVCRPYKIIGCAILACQQFLCFGMCMVQEMKWPVRWTKWPKNTRVCMIMTHISASFGVYCFFVTLTGCPYDRVEANNWWSVQGVCLSLKLSLVQLHIWPLVWINGEPGLPPNSVVPMTRYFKSEMRVNFSRWFICTDSDSSFFL